MIRKIHSCSFTGLNCQIIEVEADISNGLAMFSIVGLGDASVQESKERVRTSIKSTGASFPPTRKTVNLAPAQIRKQGAAFDLPIALSILLASKQINGKELENSIIVGELSLNGDIKAINGALAITQHAKEEGFKKIFLPKANEVEAGFIEGIEIYPLEDLRSIILHCNNFSKLTPYIRTTNRKNKSIGKNPRGFDSIVGMEQAKRAMLIAIAGGHNILLNGSPGSGKTVLARSIKSILPEMNKEEILETTKIFSVSGLLPADKGIINERPFREVHHTASRISIIGGGGANPKPGEISLAHNGVLFLDEISEFPRSVLESLRQPLEDKYISISRSRFSLRFPSNFMLIATKNPCPCGFKGEKSKDCICTKNQILSYEKKLSGPILDRFDIYLEVQKTEMQEIFETKKEESASPAFEQIVLARDIQRMRFEKIDSIEKNSDMTIQNVKEFCQINPESKKTLNNAIKSLKLSNRGYIKTLKLARTIADLERSQEILTIHLAEALQYRYNPHLNLLSK